MDESQELVVAQLRRAVHNLGSSTERYGDITLRRFLIARSFDIDKAAKMFVQWHQWRASFVPQNQISQSEITDELSAEKIFLQDLSRNGHPLVICKANKHFPAKDALQFKKKRLTAMDVVNTSFRGYNSTKEWLRDGFERIAVTKNVVSDANLSRCAEFVVHLLDKTIASGFRGKEIGNEKLVAILDLQQIGYKNVDARGLITGFQFLQSYYPERLAKCYLLNMPGFFVRVWRLVARFLEKATLEKIVIVTNEEERLEFIREVGEEVLPEEYGGKAKLVLLQDFELPPIEN